MAHDATMIATTSTKATRSGLDMRAGRYSAEKLLERIERGQRDQPDDNHENVVSADIAHSAATRA
jgi:hypothetical protein